MDATNATLHHIFQHTETLEVARYQRHYEWTADTAKALIHNLIRSFQEYQTSQNDTKTSTDTLDYFIGAFIFFSTTSKNNTKVIEVIDGQQRLATLSIIFAVLRDLIEDPINKENVQGYLTNKMRLSKNIPLPRLKLIRNDNDFFVKNILPADATSQLMTINTHDSAYKRIQSQQRFHENARVIRNAIKRHIDQDTLYHFFSYIINNCSAISIKVDTEKDAYRIFQTMNSTGQPLLEEDLLRVDLIYKITQDTKQREQKLTQWTKIEDHIGGQKWMPRLIEVASLLQYKGTLPAESGRKQYVQNITPEQAQNFLTIIDESSKVYKEIAILKKLAGIKNTNHRNRINYLLRSFALLDFYEWLPVAIILVKRYRHKSASLMKYLTTLEQISWFFYLKSDLKYTEQDRKKRFSTIIKDLLDTPNNAPTKAEGFWFSKKEKTEMRQLILGQFHPKWSMLRTLLIRIEYIYQPRDTSLLDTFSTYTIEHILPSNPRKFNDPNLSSAEVAEAQKEEDYWKKLYHDDFDKMSDASKLIGNLCLVPNFINAKMKNYSFPTKFNTIAPHIKRGTINSQLTLDSFKKKPVGGLPQWNQGKISQRTSVVATKFCSEFGI